MKNQQIESNLTALNDNHFDNEKMIFEYLNIKKPLKLNNIYFDSNSYPNFFLKENLISLKRAQIKLDRDINFLTNESLTNGLFDEKSLEPKENNLNNEAHLFKVIDPTNPELKSTDLSSNNSSNVKDISKKNCNKGNGIFLVAHYKQRGKECSEKSKLFLKKKHNKSNFDNLQTKIQVHFINFLLNFVNDIVHYEFDTNDSFKDIDYGVKKKINHEYTINLFQKPIKEIITSSITTKYKKSRTELDFNKKLYNKLTEKSKWFKEFLEMKYIDFFKTYYFNKKNPLNFVIINGKAISVSARTKSFHYLLKKENDLEEKMKDLVKNVYFNGYNKENPFVTTK